MYRRESGKRVSPASGFSLLISSGSTLKCLHISQSVSFFCTIYTMIPNSGSSSFSPASASVKSVAWATLRVVNRPSKEARTSISLPEIYAACISESTISGYTDVPSSKSIPSKQTRRGTVVLKPVISPVPEAI